MKGILLLSMDDKWFIRYTLNNITKTIPVLQQDYGSLTAEFDHSVFDFEIVDEFTHPQLFTNTPWGEGYNHAKLIFN